MSELPELRDLSDKCIYCNRLPGDECRDDCFTNIYAAALMGAPAFKPSRDLVDSLSKLIATELMTYMTMINTAMKELGDLGRIKVLTQDLQEMHHLAEALNKAGIFKNRKQVIDFYKDPTSYKRIGTLWRELGMPKESQDETWQTFQTAVSSYVQAKEENAQR